MAKNYTLDKSETTGWWVWECKDGSNGGSSPSKSEARKQAKEACTSSGYVINPPNVDAEVKEGHLDAFTIKNLDDVITTFQVPADISENEFYYFYGMECYDSKEITDAEKAITIFKIWGIYNGGTTVPEIKQMYYLNDDDFTRIIKREYLNLHITIQDDGVITWVFPGQNL